MLRQCGWCQRRNSNYGCWIQSLQCGSSNELKVDEGWPHKAVGCSLYKRT